MTFVRSANFWQKKNEMLNFENDCVPNGTTGKDANWGILIANTNTTIFIKTSI